MPRKKRITTVVGSDLAAIARGRYDFGAVARGQLPHAQRDLDTVARGGALPTRHWQVHDETGQSLGVFEGTSPTDAIARMSTALPSPDHSYGPWLHGFGIPFGKQPSQLQLNSKVPSAREFPVGFFNPSVGPAFGKPATPATEAGSVSLFTAALYGPLGRLASTTLTFTINGGAPFTITLASPVPTDAVSLLAEINAILIPFGAIATIQPITHFILFTTFMTGATASMLITGTAIVPLGLLDPPVVVRGDPPIPSAGAVEITSQPQILFRGERLVIPSSIAFSFSVLDIKVGNKSQLASTTAVHASMFIEGAVGVALGLDTATIAQDITLIVQNNTETPMAFIASLIGTTFTDMEGDEISGTLQTGVRLTDRSQDDEDEDDEPQLQQGT